MIEAAAVEGRRLSPEQERAWAAAGGEIGVVRSRWRLRGALDRAVLASCFERAVARHESLRTLLTVPAGSAVPVQSVLGSLPVSWNEAEVDAVGGPLLQVDLHPLGGEDHRLTIALPALVADRRSLAVLFRDVAEAYAGGVEREAPLQYLEYSQWHHELLGGDEAREGARFWRQLLRRAPPPPELPFAAAPEAPGGRLRFDLAADTARRLVAAAADLDAAPWEVAAAAWQALVARLSGQPDLLLTVSLEGREHPQLAEAVGLFRHEVPVRGRFDRHVPFREALEPALDALAAAAEWQELLPPAAELPRGFGFAAWERPAPVTARGVRFELEDIEVTSETTRVSLDLVTCGDGFRGVLAWKPGHLAQADAETLGRCFAVFLDSALRTPERPVGDLELVEDGERREILGPGSCSAPAAVVRHTLQALFERAVDRDPNRPALRHRDEELSFGELDRRANRLAHRLINLGVRPEVPVAILFERSSELVIACLAVLKSGGAYLPLDPAWPAHRLSTILTLASTPLLVTTASLARHLEGMPRHVGLLAVDADDALAAAPATRPAAAGGPDSLAYVIFTSGSTGEPKGVLIEHRSVINLLHGLEGAALAGEVVERVAVNAPFTFDASVKQWAQLLHGRCLDLVPEETRQVPALMTAHLVERRIDLFDCTPSQLVTLLEAGWPDPGPAVVLVGGEAIEPRLWRRLAAEGTRFVNVYGPTECTVDATSRVIAGAELPDLGRPLPGVRLYVLDDRLQPLPRGIAGELAIAGPGLARGYLARPGATADRFRPDPFAELHGERGARLYRTGDRVRAERDGRMEFLGRLDDQVKLRGHRIEIREIEAVLAAHPEVELALVQLDSAPAGDRLLAYVVCRGARRAGASAAEAADRLTTHLRDRLPAIMVPAAVVVLDAMPLTVHGKVDRRALPAPEVSARTERPYLAPRTPLEDVVAELWAEVLGIERVGAEDDFFALGGHSLLAVQVISRMRAALGVELTLRRLLDAATVAGAAAAVDELRREGTAAERPALLPVPRAGLLRMSFAQERLWFLDLLEPANPAYHIPLAVRVEGALSAAALEDALAEIERRHEVLRARFGTREGEPHVEVLPPRPRPLPCTDLGRLDEVDRQREARRLLVEELRRPFDLAEGPVLRVRLLRAADADHLVAGALHHIAGDGWSMDVLRRETLILYAAHAAGRPSPLPELPVQYLDYAAWQRSWLVGEAVEAQLRFWRRHLEGAPPAVDLVVDRPRSMVQSHRGATFHFALPAELAASLRAAGRARGATLFITLLTAFHVLLGRWSGTLDTVVGTPVAGRGRREVEDLIGLFANTLALRADLRDDPGFSSALERVRETLLAAHEHQDLPFERLVQELAPERSLARTPLFQVMYLHQTPQRPAERQARAHQGELRWTPLGERGDGAAFELTLATFETDEGLAAAFEYDVDLFDRASVERLSRSFGLLLAAAVASPTTPVSTLPLLSAAERRQVLEEWSDGGGSAARPPFVHELVAAQAARSPSAPAITSTDGRTLTYAELWQRVVALAEHLRQAGVGPEVTVAVEAERSPETVVALLAVLTAGGAYVPIDLRLPVERRERVLAETAAKLLLGRDRSAELGVRVSAVEAARPAGPPPSGSAAEEALAYVIYTSGSTGRPKGVAVTQGALGNYVATMSEVLALDPADRLLQVASIAFDAAAEEIFCCLAAGARLVLRDEHLVGSAAGFLAACASEGITVLDLPTALWHELVAALAGGQGGVPESLRLVVIGGERALPERWVQWRRLAPQVRLINSYGPTEATIAATSAELGGAAAPDRAAEPPIGRPLPGARVYVADAGQRPVPVGMPGELLIGGSGVARGYLRQPGRTARSFLPDPWSGTPGGRLYRTGDRVRWRDDGNLELLGRLDRQVKVRGHRVEPGEVEAALLSHPSVGAAAAEVRDGRLVAWVSGRGGTTPTAAGLREHLAAGLPPWMVPERLAVVAEMPRNAGGKIDRGALPDPPSGDLPVAAYVAPRDRLELDLAGVWEEVLDRRPIGVRDDFFALGGHSLLAVRLLAAVERRCGRELPLQSVFSAPTVESQGALLRAGAEGPSGSPRVQLRGGALRPLFLVHPVGGGVFCYLPLVRHLDADRPVHAFQARGLTAGEEPANGVEAMAEEYLASLREVSPHGPYLLGGWSMGGVVAVEMARRLRQDGERVDLLALLDSTLAEPGDDALERDEPARLALFADELGVPRERLGIGRQDLEGVAGGELFARVVEAAQESGVVPPGVDAGRLERLYRVFCSNLRAHSAYRPAAYDGPITLFGPRQRGGGDEPRLGRWRGLGARVERVEVSGDHFTMMQEPSVAELAAALDLALAATEPAAAAGREEESP